MADDDPDGNPPDGNPPDGNPPDENPPDENPPDENPRQFRYQPLRGTVYGVRFGTPGNLPGPLPQKKETNWLLVAAISTGVLVLVAITVAALILA